MEAPTTTDERYFEHDQLVSYVSGLFSSFLRGTVAIIGFIVALVMISWPSHGFAASPEFNQGYKTGVNEWNQFNSVGHNFECPLAKTAPHSDFCIGYDAALMFENSDQ